MSLATPTPRGWLLTFLAAAAVAVSIVNVGLATALAASALVGLLTAGFLMAQFSLYGLRLERHPNRDAFAGQETAMPVTVFNRSWRYRQSAVLLEKLAFAPGGLLRAAVPPLAPRESCELPRRFIAEKRGHFQLDRIYLCGGDPAGLFRRTRCFRSSGEIVIYPHLDDLTGVKLRFNDNSMPGAEGRPLGRAGLGQEFYGIRPYRPGDEIRFIHWKGTAARGRLMIREFEANTVDQVAILLDTRDSEIGCDPRDNNLEYLIGAATSILETMGEIYCRIHFFAADGKSGDILHLAGDAAGLRNRMLAVLMRLGPSQTDFSELVKDSLEAIPPGAVVYALSMQADTAIAADLELLADEGCYVRWLWAPKLNFPPAAPDAPRVLYPDLVRYDADTAVKPRIAAYNLPLRELLRS